MAVSLFHNYKIIGAGAYFYFELVLLSAEDFYFRQFLQ